MTLEEIQDRAAAQKAKFESAVEELSAILNEHIEVISLTDTQDLAHEIKSALDYIESAVGVFERIVGVIVDGDDEEPEEDEE